MKRTESIPKQSKRKRKADDHESTMNGTQTMESNKPDRPYRKYSVSDDPTMLGYSDNIAAACFATNAESSRQNLLSEQEKHEKRLLSNRLSAGRSRERHKVEVAHLEDQSNQLSQLIETLQHENATLREYVDKKSRQHTQQASGKSRLSLVDIASLLQPPTAAAPINTLLRVQQQASTQFFQSMAIGHPQLQYPLFHYSMASAVPSSTISSTMTAQSAASLPINLLTGPFIPASIRHLLDPRMLLPRLAHQPEAVLLRDMLSFEVMILNIHLRLLMKGDPTSDSARKQLATQCTLWKRLAAQFIL